MKHAPIIDEIVQKYEIPKELHAAIWEAYEAGIKNGFIDGGITAINEQAKLEALLEDK